MIRPFIIYFFILGWFLVGTPVRAEIYRSVDVVGKVQFTDRLQRESKKVEYKSETIAQSSTSTSSGGHWSAPRMREALPGVWKTNNADSNMVVRFKKSGLIAGSLTNKHQGKGRFVGRWSLSEQYLAISIRNLSFGRSKNNGEGLDIYGELLKFTESEFRIDIGDGQVEIWKKVSE